MFNRYGKFEVQYKNEPKVIFSSDSLIKMKIYVDEVDDEVGWLSTVIRKGNEFFVHDVYLFEQDVHGATTEITPEGLSDFAEKILLEENGVDIWNNMKLWGHSHVNMGVTPSSQDEEQIEELKKNSDFFIRVIANKKGDMKVDIMLDDMFFKNVEIDEFNPEKIKLYKLIEEASQAIEKIDTELEAKHKVKIREEIKAKVKTKKYTYLGYGGLKTYGYNGFNSLDKYDKEEDSSVVIKSYSDENIYPLDEMDFTEVEDYFTEETLIDIANAKNLLEVKEIIEEEGYKFGTFTDSEIDTIVTYAETYKDEFIKKESAKHECKY